MPLALSELLDFLDAKAETDGLLRHGQPGGTPLSTRGRRPVRAIVSRAHDGHRRPVERRNRHVLNGRRAR